MNKTTIFSSVYYYVFNFWFQLRHVLFSREDVRSNRKKVDKSYSIFCKIDLDEILLSLK